MSGELTYRRLGRRRRSVSVMICERQKVSGTRLDVYMATPLKNLGPSEAFDDAVARSVAAAAGGFPVFGSLQAAGALPRNLTRIFIRCIGNVGGISDGSYYVHCLLPRALETGHPWRSAFPGSVFFCKYHVGEVLGPLIDLPNDAARIPYGHFSLVRTSKDFRAEMGRRNRRRAN